MSRGLSPLVTSVLTHTRVFPQRFRLVVKGNLISGVCSISLDDLMAILHFLFDESVSIYRLIYLFIVP